MDITLNHHLLACLCQVGLHLHLLGYALEIKLPCPFSLWLVHCHELKPMHGIQLLNYVALIDVSLSSHYYIVALISQALDGLACH